MTSTEQGRAAPWALIIGALIPTLMIAMHPTGHDLSSSETSEALARVNVIVHAVMIAAQPLVLFGLLGLSRRLGWSELSVAAPVFYAVGAITGIFAATMSGFVAPAMIEGIAAGEAGAAALLSFTGTLNQAFATIFLAMYAVGILLWSLAILRTRALSDWLGYSGAVVAVVLAILAGRGPLGVQEMMVVTYAQAIWLVAVGVVMLRTAATPQ